LTTIRRQRHARKGEVLKIYLGGLMAPWTFNVKFLYDMQFHVGSLMFAAGEVENLELLTQGSAPSHH
jgi:hypothetical protein